jgi:hypothetical protein
MVAMAAMFAWGLIHIAIGFSDHGWTFSHDMQLGLGWAALGLIQLIWGGRKLTAAKSQN